MLLMVGSTSAYLNLNVVIVSLLIKKILYTYLALYCACILKSI